MFRHIIRLAQQLPRRNMSTVRKWEQVPRQVIPPTSSAPEVESAAYMYSVYIAGAVFMAYCGLYGSLALSAEIADRLNPVAEDPARWMDSYKKYITKSSTLPKAWRKTDDDDEDEDDE